MADIKIKKLMHVSTDNGATEQSNKYYNMYLQDNGQIRVEYGRVGGNPKVEYKSGGDSVFNKLFIDKTQRKGEGKNYKDVTNLFVEQTVIQSVGQSQQTLVDIKNDAVKKLFDQLMAFANKSIQHNYKVTQESVTQTQIDEAQRLINNISTQIKIGANVKQLNALLLELYAVIPRKMKNVKDYLFNQITEKRSLESAQKLIANEQDTLDTMAGQVTLLKQQKAAAEKTGVNNSTTQQVDILTQMGLEIVPVDDNSTDYKTVQKMMGSNASQTRKVFKIVNVKTQKLYDNFVNKAKNKASELLWHGSRNENWFNIIQTGLLIRPSGAVHTGSMFGDGIYGANKAQKSIGYTSARGSYWANGSSNVAYLALFEFHVGNQKHITHHNSDCYTLNKSKLEKEGFDSVYAHGGADLRNDEFIVYDAHQVTIKYLIEIAG